MTYKEFARCISEMERLDYLDGIVRLSGSYPKLYQIWLNRVGHHGQAHEDVFLSFSDLLSGKETIVNR